MAARAYRTRSYSGDNSRQVLPAFRSNVAPMRPSLPMTKISADPPCFSAPLWRPYSEVRTPNEKSAFGKGDRLPRRVALHVKPDKTPELKREPFTLPRAPR